MEQETNTFPPDDNVPPPTIDEPIPSGSSVDHQQNSTNLSDAIETAKTRALEFLSTASNEALGACLVGLGAATYIVLGRVGLVLIGVVGGVALHASWDHITHGEEDNTAKKIDLNRRRETSLEVVRRVLDWRQKQMTTGAETESEEAASVGSSGYSTFRPATAIALDTLSNAIMKDYVKWWYSSIIPSDLSFPSACRQTLEAFILSFSSNLSRKRPADTFLDFVTNSSSIMIVFLNELSAALSASPNNSPLDAIHTYLDERPDSHMANIFDSSQQQKKLHMIANDILERFLDANVYKCLPARSFLREILANIVLEKTLQSCSRNEWINGWIIHLLEEGEPELMNVIDHGIDGSAVQQAVGDLQQPFKRVNSFEITEDGIVVDTGGDVIEETLHEANRQAQLTAAEQSGMITADDDASDSTRGIETPSSQDDKDAEEEAFASKLSVTMIDAAPSSPAFINFDQLAPSQHSSARAGFTPDRQARQLASTLHKAHISIFDDSEPGDNRTLRSKPNIDYLIQIEPASLQFPGWMIARTYGDFENLHEVLRRISAISGVGFISSHVNLPHWRGLTEAQLRDRLERYIIDAVAYETLAESEGMKRFLEKDRGLSKSPSDKGGFWPNAAAFENMGKGMLDVLTKAPKGVAGGSRAVFGGVTSVITGSGLNESKRNLTSPSPLSRSTTSMDSRRGSLLNNGNGSQETSRRPSIASGSPKQSDDIRRSSSSSRRETPSRQGSSVDLSRMRVASADVPVRATPIARRIPRPVTPAMELPPPPSDVDDDYLSPAMTSWPATPRNEVSTPQMSIEETSIVDVRSPWSRPPSPVSTLSTEDRKSTESRRPAPKIYSPLSEKETQVTVELLFAIINELYTLSSAWNIRRTLLTAAKTFLVRTGNPQLESIRVLLQESILDANTSDEGLAAHILKLRESSLPTEEELKTWPQPPSDEQKEAMRKKARKLLVERGMPQALTSVMGGPASGEALGKVFDSLQIEEVARGLMFGLMLQAVRALVQ